MAPDPYGPWLPFVLSQSGDRKEKHREAPKVRLFHSIDVSSGLSRG